MKYISNDKLKEYITGAVCFKEADDGLIPYRFSEEKLLLSQNFLAKPKIIIFTFLMFLLIMR